MMRAMIPSMHVDVASGHSAAEEHVEELLGGNVGLKTARVVVVIMVSAAWTRLRFRFVGAV